MLLQELHNKNEHKKQVDKLYDLVQKGEFIKFHNEHLNDLNEGHSEEFKKYFGDNLDK